MLQQAIYLLAVGDINQADRLSVASLALARENWDSLLGCALCVRADVVGRDDRRIAEAIAMLQEGADLGSGQEYPSWDHPSVLSAMGTLWIRLGERERGVRLINDALDLVLTRGWPLQTGETYLQLGQLDRLDGRSAQAAGRLAASLRAFREAGAVTPPCLSLAELAWVAIARGHQETAARIDGMIQAVVDRAIPVFEGGMVGVLMLVEWPTRTAVRHTHPAAFDAGRALAFDAAISEAIAIADALAAGHPPPGAAQPRLPHAPARLSAREQHVLTLLAQRYTAPEIAEQLFLSVRTVERHVSNVYNKLGVNSRRDAVAAASQHGLV
jgi:ATP/maltotriose-dependent transcriptional regulator MalT